MEEEDKDCKSLFIGFSHPDNGNNLISKQKSRGPITVIEVKEKKEKAFAMLQNIQTYSELVITSRDEQITSLEWIF